MAPGLSAGGTAARDVRRRARPGSAERETVLFGQWFCVGRLDDLGLADAVAGGRRRRGGGVGARHERRGRSRCTAPTTSVGTAARRSSRCVEQSSAAGRLRGVGAALSLPLVDLRARRPAAARTAHGPRRPGRRRTSGSTRSRWRPGAASSSCTSHPTRDAPLGDAVSRAATTLANYGLAGLVTGATLTYEVAANYKVLLENYNECYHCGPVHPELCRLVPSFAGRRRRPRLGGRRPAPRGRLDVHHDRHDDAGAAARSDRGGAHPAQGRPRLPEPDALGLGRPRRRVRAAAARGRPDRRGVLAALRRRRGRPATTSTPATPRELWDLVNRQDWAVCESVQRGMSSRSYRHGWFAPMEDDSLDIRRWLLPLLGGQR